MQPLGILPIKGGTAETIRALCDGPILGLFYHHHNRHSKFCRGVPDCPAVLHRDEPTWKGYTAVEVWRDRDSLWHPAILEVSEHLELMVRGLWRRGQIWEIYREPARKKRNNGRYLGTLLDTQDAVSWQQPFDLLGVLRRVYADSTLRLAVDNPQPPLLYLEPVAGEPPPNRIGRRPVEQPPIEPLQFQAERARRLEFARHPGVEKTPEEKRAEFQRYLERNGQLGERPSESNGQR